MGAAEKGVVAAGHPLTAEAGARVLREGGNAVDAAVGAMLTSFAAEQLLTGLGAGGYMLVAGGGRAADAARLLRRGADRIGGSPARMGPRGRASGPPPAELRAVDVSFGDAAQVFHIGPASCGVYGTPAGVCAAIERWGTCRWRSWRRRRRELARDGRGAERGAGIHREDPRRPADLDARVRGAVGARRATCCREGELLRNPELGDALALLGEEGAEPFYRGEIAAAVCDWLRRAAARCRARTWPATSAVEREPVSVRYRDREVLTNPPPSAGGTLLAYALALLDRGPAPPRSERRGGGDGAPRRRSARRSSSKG